MPVDLFHKTYSNPNSNRYLIILHGLFGMLDNWHKIAKSLSSEINVVTVDLRNHGQSPHTDEMSLKLMSEDLSKLFETLGIEKAILMGHSMGGKVAMAFADQFPQYLEKLIVVDIAPKEYPRGHDRYFKAFRELDFASFENRKDADDALAEREPVLAIRQFLLKNIDRKEGGGYELKLNVEAIEKFYPSLIQSLDFQWIIDVPSLFINGAKSEYILEEDRAVIAETFTNAEFETIEGAGHWIHAEKPEEFKEVVRRFI
ncbi:alpha/beta fold hydrolase [bacterium]|nr:alpha/beta fold hydrolase [bacterium]